MIVCVTCKREIYVHDIKPTVVYEDGDGSTHCFPHEDEEPGLQKLKHWPVGATMVAGKLVVLDR